MSPRAATVALFCSAALNLFLVGAMVGLAAMDLRHAPARSGERPPLRGAAMSLAPSDRSRLLATLRTQAVSVRPLLAEAHGVRRDAWAALGQNVFDPTGVKATLAKARALDQQARGTVEDGVVDFAATLPAAERVAFGRAMQRALPQADRPGRPSRHPFWRRPG